MSTSNTAPTFLVGGKVITVFNSYSYGHSVTVQANGKILVAGSNGHSGLHSNDFALVRYNRNGSVDTSFSGDGKVTTDFGSDDYGSSVYAQANGKILVAGSSGVDYDSKFALVRYNSDGSLDTSFDSDGKVTTDVINSSGASSLTVQPNGKILVAGGANNHFALVRYNSTGTLDTSFGDNGIVVTSGIGYYGASVALQADGKILVTGYGGFILVRFNSNGTLDTSFDSDGKVTTDFGYFDVSESVTLQNDGKIIVAGVSQNQTPVNGRLDTYLVLARYNSNGSLDTSFSNDGKVITSFGDNASLSAQSVTLQDDGKILVTGFFSQGDNSDFGLVRYNINGSLDTSFGKDGIVITDLGSNRDGGYSVTVQTDGKILVSGVSESNFSLVRYNSNGSLDRSFGTIINTLSDMPTYTENGLKVVLDSTVEAYDAELAAQGHYKGASITLTRHSGANSQDVFSSSGSLSFSGSNALLSGISIGTLSNRSGTLKISFNNNATQDRVNQALSSLAYNNSSDTPPASVKIDWIFSDGNIGTQGAGSALKALGTTTVHITPTNDTPMGTVTFTGLATEGQILTAFNSLADADGLGVITYTWNSNNTMVGTGKTYAVKTSDVGKFLSVTASYTDHGGTYEKKTSTEALIGIIKTGTTDGDALFGTTGNDSLSGAGGNDVLVADAGDDILDGGSGNDALVGGTGNDTYIVDASGDSITEASGGGIDTVKSSIGINLAIDLENLFLTGTAAINGTGNDSANILSGNGANNVLSAGAGNDLLIGGTGNDTLTGGTGQDVFRFNSALTASIDKITDFVIADDTMQLENAIFTKLMATGVLNTAYLKTGSVAADANDFVIYNETTGALFYDDDGNGVHSAVQVAVLGITTHPVLTNADFVVI